MEHKYLGRWKNPKKHIFTLSGSQKSDKLLTLCIQSWYVLLPKDKGHYFMSLFVTISDNTHFITKSVTFFFILLVVIIL